jgi:hypothetical protein
MLTGYWQLLPSSKGFMHNLIVENPIICTHWKLNDDVLKPSIRLSLTQTTMYFLERIDIWHHFGWPEMDESTLGPLLLKLGLKNTMDGLVSDWMLLRWILRFTNSLRSGFVLIVGSYGTWGLLWPDKSQNGWSVHPERISTKWDWACCVCMK